MYHSEYVDAVEGKRDLDSPAGPSTPIAEVQPLSRPYWVPDQTKHEDLKLATAPAVCDTGDFLMPTGCAVRHRVRLLI